MQRSASKPNRAMVRTRADALPPLGNRMRPDGKRGCGAGGEARSQGLTSGARTEELQLVAKKEEEEEGKRRRRGRKVELGLASGNGPRCQAPGRGGVQGKRRGMGAGPKGNRERIGDLGAPKARDPGPVG